MQTQESKFISVGAKILFGIPFLIIIFLLIVMGINAFPFIEHDLLSLLGLLH